MTELVIYRGLPGSGKTTAAKAWVDEDPTGRARVNRDTLRLMLHGRYVGAATERQVTAARDAAIRALLVQGVSVVSDDTNLRSRYARGMAQLGVRAGATVEVIDLTDVPLEECIRRDMGRYPSDTDVLNAGSLKEACRRSGYVGEDVICDMHTRYIRGGIAPLVIDKPPAEDGWYTPKPGKMKAIMVDLDGTLCIHDGRGPYDETLVSTDIPNPPVVETVRAFAKLGYLILFVSGRSALAPRRRRTGSRSTSVTSTVAC